MKAFNDRINHLATNFWMNESRDDIFAPTTADDQLSIDSLSVQLARSQSLAGLYDTLLDRIVDAAESSAVSFRTKALRGISLIVAQDPNLFHRVCFFFDFLCQLTNVRFANSLMSRKV